jgi:hypothetical protein
MRDGIVFRLVPLARLTREIGFGLLPTPTDASKGGGSSRSGNRRDEIPTLQGMARKGLWPTPRVSDGNGAGRHGDGGLDLRTAVQMWPTPTVGDSRSARNSTANRKTIPPSGVHPGDTLVDAVTKFPTPNTTQYYTTNSTTSKTPTLVGLAGGKLNPRWVEWLMGFPIGWLSLEPLEMLKFRQWLEQHG